MLIKMYKNYTPRASEVYSQIRTLGLLSLIERFANKQNLKSLSAATLQEINFRKGSPEYTLDKISMVKLLQKDSISLENLSKLYKLAVHYDIVILAICIQATMISNGDRDEAKKLFKEEFEKNPSFILTELGKDLLVNLYKDSSDSILDIESHTLRRFLAEQA